MSERKKVIMVLMCCHNRKNKTLSCLERLYAQALTPQYLIAVTLVDDKSSDHTAFAVREQFPEVKIVEGNGNLFWAGAMRIAYLHAGQADFYLWLNDDTNLFDNALATMLASYQQCSVPMSIITGAILDTTTTNVTYGGLRRIHPQRLRFQVIEPSNYPKECDATNGNCVLIPSAVYTALNNIDPIFKHAHGDIDFGLRAKQANIKIFLASGYIAHCTSLFLENRVYRSSNLLDQLKIIVSIKCLHPMEWLTLCRRHSKKQLFRSFLSPYFRTLQGRPLGFVQRPHSQMLQNNGGEDDTLVE